MRERESEEREAEREREKEREREETGKFFNLWREPHLSFASPFSVSLVNRLFRRENRFFVKNFEN